MIEIACLVDLPSQRVGVVDVKIARVHDSDDVSTGRCNDKVTDAIIKAPDVKQLRKRADVNKPNNSVLT